MSLMLKRYDALLLLATVALVLLYVLSAGPGFPLDDSWIHQVYARNLAQLGEWSFIAGEPSAASTSPLYTVLLSIGYRLGLPYALWTHALGAAALWVCGVVGARMAEHLLPRKKYMGLLTGLMLVAAWHLVWAAVAGMETMLFSTLTLLLIALSWREMTARSDRARDILLRGGVFGAVAALTTLARPEGVLLAGITGLMLIVSRPVPRVALLWAVGAGAAFAVLMAPYLLLNLQLTGGLMPNTAGAKYAQMAPIIASNSYPQRVWAMIFPLIAGGQVLLLPGMLFYAWRYGRQAVETRNFIYWLPLIWAVSLILLYAARLPAPFQHGRYVIPVLPSLLVAGLIGLVHLSDAAVSSLLGRAITRALLAATALVIMTFAVALGPGIYQKDVAIIEEEMVASAKWLAANIPPEELLAVHDIGAVGYFAPRPILDIAGLVNPEVIPILHDKEALYALMQQRDARYLLAFPDQVPGDDLQDSRLCPVYTTGGTSAPGAGGANMTIYALQWNGDCND